MPSMIPSSNQAIFGFYQPHHIPDSIDQSPVRLPSIIGKDELKWYKYAPIDPSEQIRLIEILPPQKSAAERNSIEILRCKIHVSPFPRRTPEYEALSYTWGQIDRHLPISILTNELEEKAIFATPQVLMALKRLRLPSTSRMLWIDQLSIDQDNDDEKGPQVQLMGHIYSKAKRVLIWLGEDLEYYVYESGYRKERTAELLADMIDTFSKATNKTSAADLELVLRLVDVRPTYHVVSIQERRLAAICNILDRPWFRRAWVFQEASLAQELLIHYGSLEVKFEDLKRLVDAVSLVESATGISRSRSLEKDTPGFEMIQIIDAARQRVFNPHSVNAVVPKGGRFLITLLQVLRRVEAYNPCDLIYALLAFQAGEGITVTGESYRQPQEETWIHAAASIIKASTSLDIFAALSGDKERKLQLPSWVPFWSDCFPYSRPIATPISRFCASRSMPHNWRQAKNPREMLVQGKIIDIVKQVARPFGDFQAAKHDTSLFLALSCSPDSVRHWLREAVPPLGDQLAVRLETAPKDFMRTALADGAMGMEQPLCCMEDMFDSNMSSQQAWQLRRNQSSTTLSAEQEKILRNYEKLENLVFVAERKSVFMTENLQLGMAPAVQPGDEVAILHGSKVPCIFRKTGSRPEEYRVISQCYLDGWMYGNEQKDKDRPHPHSMWWTKKQDEFVLV